MDRNNFVGPFVNTNGIDAITVHEPVTIPIAPRARMKPATQRHLLY